MFVFGIPLGLGRFVETHRRFLKNKYKVGCVFPMIIWAEFRMGQYRDEDHRKDALLFTWSTRNSFEFNFDKKSTILQTFTVFCSSQNHFSGNKNEKNNSRFDHSINETGKQFGFV